MSKKIKIRKKKTTIAYCGSLIQQNFGESVNGHGFLVWDLDTMQYEEVNIHNDYGYYTLDIDGGIIPTIHDIPKYAKLRIKISNTDLSDTKVILSEIKKRYGVDDFIIIHTDSIANIKTGNRKTSVDLDDIYNIEYQNKIISQYLKRMIPTITDSELSDISNIHRKITSNLKVDDFNRNINWKPIEFEFSNMFSYGDGNKINFTKINGLYGLFAPNASGKSSLFDAISFCMFDKSSRAFKASHIMNNRCDTFRCKLWLKIDGIDYYIQRDAKTHKRGTSVKVDVNFWRVVDGKVESLNGNERRDTNSIIEQYVGKYEDFVLTSLSLQNNNAIFIDKTQSERKDLLAQFMGLSTFDQLYEAARDDIRETSVLIRNFKRTDLASELADNETLIASKKLDFDRIQSNLKSMNNDRDMLNEELYRLNKSIVNIDTNIDIDKLINSKLNIENKIKSISSELEEKTKKVNEYEKLLNEISKSIVDVSMVNGKPIDISKKEFDELNIKQLDIKNKIDTLQLQYSSNLNKLKKLEQHKYDPNCEYCMNNVFVKDAISTKSIVKTQESELKLLLSEYDLINKSIESMSDVSTIWDTYTELNNRYQRGITVIQTMQVELSGMLSKKELYITQLSIVLSDIDKYYANEMAISENKKTELIISKIELQKSEIEKNINIYTKELLSINSDLASLTSYICDIQQKLNEIKSLELKNKLYTYYLDAVNRDGVPYELISKAMPIIEAEVNAILNQIVEFGVKLHVDGKNINASISYNGQYWPLEMCSGMEKFISGLAIRVALINICGLPRPNFLVIDEGFGTLDSDNISSLYGLMQYLKTQFDFICVISHLDQMRDIVDGLIEIKKENGFSKINY